MTIHPKEAMYFYGHEDASATMVEAYHSGNLPHAWLISGVKGIGKATLAYRFARFLFHNGKIQANTQQSGLFGEMDAMPVIDGSMEIPLDSQIIHYMKQGVLPDLKILESPDEEGKTDIGVDKVRELQAFLSQTPSIYDWRIVVIDSIDDLNRNAANALLKILEEPPKNTVIFLISHRPGRLLPTIKSRCRKVDMRALTPEDAQRVMAMQDVECSSKDLALAIAASGGAAGVALMLARDGLCSRYEELVHLLCKSDPSHQAKRYILAEQYGGARADEVWQEMTFLLVWFLHVQMQNSLGLDEHVEFFDGEAALKSQWHSHYSVDQLPTIWEKVQSLLSQEQGLHMNRSAVWLRICEICAV